jgi:WAS/WASL-interacting protein
MAPLPPPPPPAPPPPPPMAGLPGAAPKLGKNGAMDRNALLSQIRGGAKLKKATVVNDRSQPLIEGKSASSSAKTSAASSGSKTLSNGPLQLGELFSGGVPKLKPTGKLNTNGASNSVNKINNVKFPNNEKVGEHRSQNTASTIKSSLEEKLNFNSQNNASFLHTKTSPSSESNRLITNKNKYHTINVSKPRERSVISSEGKGQAPQVPTASANTSPAPSLPIKPIKLQRSNSQSNSQNNKAVRAPRPGPPNIKPPPPPKISNSSNVSQSSNSKNNVNRRQSIGDSDKYYQEDSWNGKTDISSLVNNFNNQGFKPPAPSRNGFSQSPTYPPPPPPLSTLPNRVDSGSVTGLTQPYKQMAPPLPSQLQPSRVQPNIRPPLGPPPPPPHRTTSNANSSTLYPSNGAAPPPPPPAAAAPAPPHSQTKVIPPSLRNGVATAAAHAFAPPPPVRNTSISREEFAARFATFKAICELPAPQPISNFNKQYPSHLQQSQRRRDPPPPPPQSNGTMAHTSPHLNAHNSNNAKKFASTPMLHIQFGSSVAQC